MGAPDASAVSIADRDTLWCLFRNGPTWDGNIPSKASRDRLVADGLAYRENGWTLLTVIGFTAATALGMHNRKGTR